MLPRGRWKKGVVTRLIPGRDGQVRGAAIRCIVNGKQVEYERPVQRLVPFELIPERPDCTVDDPTASTISESSNCPDVPTATTRVRRRAAVTGEMLRRYTNQV